MTFVPADFSPPRSFDGPGFRLEPLGPEHNERDHRAWTSSIDHIRSTPGFPMSDDWPFPLDLDENMADMVMHAGHFADRVGFTYSVVDGDDVIGCLYVYPFDGEGHDADVRSWVTQDRAGMDAVVWRAVEGWLHREWPFARPCYVGRPS
jgi:hypothetical protein